MNKTITAQGAPAAAVTCRAATTEAGRGEPQGRRGARAPASPRPRPKRRGVAAA